jgi:DTW domain-containing protein YfiP
VCDHLRPIEARAGVVVLAHRNELQKPTNTGRLVPLLVSSGQVRLRGDRGAPLDLSDLVAGAVRPLLLDPGGAVLDEALLAADPRPVTLVLTDGTWRQARRIARHEPALLRMQRVSLPEGGAPTRYRLRHPRGPGKVCTLEAVARALAVTEGPRGPEVQAHIEAAFDIFVEATLHLRSGAALD